MSHIKAHHTKEFPPSFSPRDTFLCDNWQLWGHTISVVIKAQRGAAQITQLFSLILYALDQPKNKKKLNSRVRKRW